MRKMAMRTTGEEGVILIFVFALSALSAVSSSASETVTMKAGCHPMVVYGTLVETRKGNQTEGVA